MDTVSAHIFLAFAPVDPGEICSYPPEELLSGLKSRIGGVFSIIAAHPVIVKT